MLILPDAEESQHKENRGSRNGESLAAEDSDRSTAIQRRQERRFAIEARQSVRIIREDFRQNFNGYISLQAVILRAVDLAHSPGADLFGDSILEENLAGQIRSCVADIVFSYALCGYRNRGILDESIFADRTGQETVHFKCMPGKRQIVT
jgi:hypothetical protein